jgi:hypothetical protein
VSTQRQRWRIEGKTVIRLRETIRIVHVQQCGVSSSRSHAFYLKRD